MILNRILRTCLNIATPSYIYKYRSVSLLTVFLGALTGFIAIAAVATLLSDSLNNLLALKIAATTALWYSYYLSHYSKDHLLATWLAVITIALTPVLLASLRVSNDLDWEFLLLLGIAFSILINYILLIPKYAVVVSVLTIVGSHAFIKIYFEAPMEYFIFQFGGLLLFLTGLNIFVNRERKKMAEEESKVVQPYDEYEQVSLISSVLPVGVIQTDRYGMCVHTNEMWHKITGQDFHQNAGAGWFQIFYKEDKNTILKNHCSNESAGPTKAEYELLVGKNLKSVSLQCAPLYDGNGLVKGYIGVLEDITLQKKEEAMLKQQSLLIDNTYDAIILLDVNGGIISLNQAAEEMSGWEVGGAISDFINTISQLEGHDWRVKKMLREVVKNGTWKGELEYLKQNKTPMETYTSFTLVNDNKGEAVGIVGIINDVTELKQIKERERYQSLLLNNITDAVVSMNTEGVIVLWSDRAQKMFGWHEDEVVGRVMSKVISSLDKVDVFKRTINQVILNGEWRGDVTCARKNGTTMDVGASFALVSGVQNEYGKTKHIVATLTDISERKNTEQNAKELIEKLEEQVLSKTTEIAILNTRLQEVSKERARFIADVSHELQTPLLNIKTSMSSISREKTGSQLSSVENFDGIAREIQEITRILSNRMSSSHTNSEKE